MTDEVIKRLMPSARDDDQKAFRLYSSGEISLKECESRFRFNNHLPKWIEFTNDEFVDWMRGLGYRCDWYGIEQISNVN